jgi:hypothetical protein
VKLVAAVVIQVQNVSVVSKDIICLREIAYYALTTVLPAYLLLLILAQAV